MNNDFLPDLAPVRNPAARNLPTRFTPADAPPAAVNRTLRRSWAAEANRELRRTGEPDAARRAGAKILVAALDCDVIAFQSVRAAGARVPVNLPVAAKRREHNIDGAANRVAEVILAGGRP
jgi:hypothetical protein